MQLSRSAKETHQALEAIRQSGKRTVFVPTMGALHEGHRSLFRKAKDMGGFSVASIFVNPTQFNQEEDFKKYPRPLEIDLTICEEEKVDFVFAPPENEIYPDGLETDIPVPNIGLLMEGEFRPGHFAGVCTVVHRLFEAVNPTIALFGEKDYQQYLVIRDMVKKQNRPISIISCPTIRDRNGLALSSRNRRLSPAGYEKALTIPRLLRSAQQIAQEGEREASKIISQSISKISSAEADQLKIDYLKIVDSNNLEPLKKIDNQARILIAAWVEGIRLIDNDRLI
ncbi:MAG: pantoate--beta-alanine ligase [Deltaproteobacteria bacterium]|nr:pantoate--beta-alanine ligase [Deltaproteobacteria bacterium]